MRIIDGDDLRALERNCDIPVSKSQKQTFNYFIKKMPVKELEIVPCGNLILTTAHGVLTIYADGQMRRGRDEYPRRKG